MSILYFYGKKLSANNMLPMYCDLAKQYVSSTNLFHNFTLLLTFGIIDVSSSTGNMLTNTETNGEPIATLST